MTQEEVVVAVVRELEGLDIPYMITGSFASNLHGVPRMTQDADVVVHVDQASASKLVERLEGEFYVSREAVREAVSLRRLFNVIHLATGLKVDLVVKKQRPHSDEELRRRCPGMLGGREVTFATAEDTVLSKLEWAQLAESDRQYFDAVGVIEVQAGQLDWPYLERWSEELGISDLLARARAGEPFR